MHNQEEILILSELKGLALGLLADGKIDQREAEFLQDWLFKNSARVKESYVLSMLYRRVSEMLEDEMLSHKESRELFTTLQRLSLSADAASRADTLPDALPDVLSDALDDTGPLTLIPAGSDIFDMDTELDFSKPFSFSGIFAFGSRESIEDATLKQGGEVVGGVRKDDCYLVVGSLVSPDWLRGNYGTKIMKAREHRANGGTVKIIPEYIWARHVA